MTSAARIQSFSIAAAALAVAWLITMGVFL